MRPLDVVRLAGGALSGHGRRTALSLLGMTVGVAAVLVLTAVGEGARTYVVDQFAALGSDLIGVVPGRSETTGVLPGLVGGTPHDLTLDDARAVQRALPDALHVAPMAVGNDELAAGDRSRQVLVLGTTPAFLPVRRLELRAGRFVPDGPWDRGSPVVVLGAKLAAELFPGRNPLGERVRLGGWRLRVIGVLAPHGTQLGLDLDEVAFAPVATVMQMFDRSSLFRIAVGMRPGADLAATGRRIEEVIAARHGELDVTVVTQDAVLGALGRILLALSLALSGIGAISLGVAGVGIMNVMLVSVSERTAEVGLLKALGAAPRQVLALFVTEAALLSSAGGAAGVALGLAVVRVARAVWPALPLHAPTWAVVASLGVALVVGVLFGVLPARRAMRLAPVEALAGR